MTLFAGPGSRFNLGLALAVAIVALGTAEVRATQLIRNPGSGSFVGAATWSYDDNGVVSTTSNPFTFNGGGNSVNIGADSVVTLSTTGTLDEVRVGTFGPVADLTGIGGPDLLGNGTLNVTGSTSLTLPDPMADTSAGHLVLGRQVGVVGPLVAGNLNWNSTGTLEAQGFIRIGEGGVGTVTQTAGTVITANVDGGGKFMSVGQLGGTGTYNLNAGTLEVGSGFDFVLGVEQRRLLRVGLDTGSTGVINLGDGTGAPGSARIESWDEVAIGEFGSGTLNVRSDGLLQINAPVLIEDPDTGLYVGRNGSSNGLVNHQGGTVAVDGSLRVGVGTGAGTYQLVGSTGSLSARALQVGSAGQLSFTFDANGVTPIQLVGSSAPGFDTGLGVTINSGATVSLNDLDEYTSNGDLVLIDSLDSAAGVNGLFSNLSQAASVGVNSLGEEFFLNYFGGTDNNDVVLQTTVPSSITNGLVWAVDAANFDSGFFRGNGNFGTEASPTNPLGPSGSPTNDDLFLGNGGVATLDDTTSSPSGMEVRSIQIGTIEGSVRVAGTNGDGTLAANGSVSLTATDVSGGLNAGDVTVGRQGAAGELNWNSTGTLAVEGRFRVGQGGSGVVTQTAGVITAGNTPGGGEYVGIGELAGGDGVYHLNAGELRPGGGDPFNGRFLRIGFQAASGALNVGDGIGIVGSAAVITQDDIEVGSGLGGTGVLNLSSDGAVNLVGNTAVLVVGINGGSGVVSQTGGTVTSDALMVIGALGGGEGRYTISSGSLTTTVDGEFDELRIGANTGSGVLRIEGDAAVSVDAGDLVLAQIANTLTSGRLEIEGSDASLSVGRLINADGPMNDETFRWEADSNGVTSLVVTGTTAVETPENFVQLQSLNEAASNTGANGSGNLSGNGIDLELDLSALSGDLSLTLIDNLTSEGVIGFFENPFTEDDLYEEGESILGTGFNGSVTISYVGGNGNDVVLSLLAGVGLPGDFNGDGMVDAADYSVYRDNLNDPTEAALNGNGDGVNGVDVGDYNLWAANYGAIAPLNAQAVPEPTAFGLALTVVGLLGGTLLRARSPQGRATAAA